MKRVRHVINWGLISVAAVALLLVLYTVFGVAPRIRSKSEALHDSALASYRGFFIDVAPEAQFESHTCGLHTLRVIYRSYGLDPGQENLRFRIGLDTPANPIDSESTGTLQPDMLRVLHQDGISYEFLDLADVDGSADRLINHLEGGDMAAVLIARRENGTLHWVAAQNVVNSELVILDSLQNEPYYESPSSFVRDVVISCLLLEPSASPTESRDSSLSDGAFAIFDAIKQYSVVIQRRAEQDGGGDKPPNWIISLRAAT